MARATTSRILNDVGLAAWFGGSLMGAVGLNGAASKVRDPIERADVARDGWRRWNRVNALFVVGHLVGAIGLTGENRRRVAAQRGVATTTAVDAVLTTAAVVATLWSAVVGRRVHGQPVATATEPSSATPPAVADAQRRQRVLQWVVPALTGGMLVADAVLGEQQRPSEVSKGVLRRLLPGA